MPRDRQGRFTPADSDSFLKEWIDRGPIVVVETARHGSECIPCDVCGTPPGCEPGVAYDIEDDECPAELREWAESALMYCEGGKIQEVTYHPDVYYGRYSAPGYMDCTSWSWSRNKRHLERELRSMYGSED